MHVQDYFGNMSLLDDDKRGYCKVAGWEGVANIDEYSIATRRQFYVLVVGKDIIKHSDMTMSDAHRTEGIIISEPNNIKRRERTWKNKKLCWRREEWK